MSDKLGGYLVCGLSGREDKKLYVIRYDKESK